MSEDKETFTVSELLFDRNRYSVLRALYDSETPKSIVELAEMSDCSRQFVSTYLDRLSRTGLVEKEKKGNMYIISLNRDSPYYNPVEELMVIDSRPLERIAERFAEKIFSEDKGIESVVLFGSVARGRPKIDSDIDILIITSDGSEQLKKDLRAEEESFSKEKALDIAITFYDEQEFLKDLKASRKFVENVLRDGKLLKGEKIWER